jgi:hypothetical protein
MAAEEPGSTDERQKGAAQSRRAEPGKGEAKPSQVKTTAQRAITTPQMAKVSSKICNAPAEMTIALT